MLLPYFMGKDQVRNTHTHIHIHMHTQIHTHTHIHTHTTPSSLLIPLLLSLSLSSPSKMDLCQRKGPHWPWKSLYPRYHSLPLSPPPPRPPSPHPSFLTPSSFLSDTAVAKLLKFCNSALDFRQQQETELGYQGGCAHAQAKKLGDVTTVNLTMLEAGVSLDGGKTFSLNVIPHGWFLVFWLLFSFSLFFGGFIIGFCEIEARAGFDIRMSPSIPMEEMLALLDQWAKEAGDGVSWQNVPGFKVVFLQTCLCVCIYVYLSMFLSSSPFPHHCFRFIKYVKKHCVTSIEGDDCDWWDVVRAAIVEVFLLSSSFSPSLLLSFSPLPLLGKWKASGPRDLSCCHRFSFSS